MAARELFWRSAAALVGVVAVLGVWAWIEATPVPRVMPPPGEALVIDKSPQAQNERKAVIDRLLADGLVRRFDHERTGALRASLRPAFYNLDEPTRRKYIDTIYAFYFDGSSVTDTVILRDARHGNEVGQYNPYKGGLQMYK
jgi:hypothetical protein